MGELIFYMEPLMYLVIGTLLSAILGCLPALHIYNIAGILIILWAKISWMGGENFIALCAGLVVGYSIVSTVPAIFLGAPDEAAMFMVMPGQKYLMQGRGYEASIITGIGGLGAAFAMLLLTPFLPIIVRTVRTVFSPHMGWILTTILFYIIMSEFPKGGDRGKPLQKFLDGWGSIFAGLFTLFISGFLGMILIYKPFVNTEFAFQNIMPAFVGLYAVPWVVLNLMSRGNIPKQHIAKSTNLNWELVTRGTGAGMLGGMFAAIFPVVTGGIGGLFAGHATAQRDERLFVMSQGVSKFAYYVGAFLLFFIPGAALTRGGMAWMISSIYMPYGNEPYYRLLGFIAISAAISFFMLILFSKLMIKFIHSYNYRVVNWITLIFILTVVMSITGYWGLIVMIVCTGIGLIPVMYSSRRMNCMGVLLIPITFNMLGIGPKIAAIMGLV
ncbi:MAG: tripartite tricarboxylate transporter permease [Candidatus Muirbacterium halophilum]|nr:tripartite tricarboxylate transporter permease [Candidatus Muirbacterium halophilum]MCK9475350.1 tripartite tricarboxylate transporter permease [Candidatus Muirbacterium halophilum]